MHVPKMRRTGLTLVELLVVIGVLAFLLTLTALYFPRYQERELVSRGADSLQGWLLIAKQQAMRDGLPTGLRLYIETDPERLENVKPPSDNTHRYVRRLRYVQQPDDVAQGNYVGYFPAGGGSGPVALFSLPVGVAFGSPRLPVLPGDYLVLYGVGSVHRIAQVQPDRLVLDPGTGPLLGEGRQTGFTIPPYDPSRPVNYRIIRQPVPLDGEQELTLPDNIFIDLFHCRGLTLVSAPERQANGSYAWLSCFEILFSPAGSLIGRGTGSGQAIFWLRDATLDNSTDILGGYARLITVQPRSGFIAAHPVSSKPGDPYEFTRDGKSSGM